MSKTRNIEICEDFLKQKLKISKKQAEKIIDFIISSNEEDFKSLISNFNNLKQKIKKCKVCNNISDNNLCEICSDEDRDKVLLIVENQKALDKFENSKFYYGKYFIINEKFILKNDFSDEELLKEVSKIVEYAAFFEETIIALSPTLQGEIITYHIKKTLDEAQIQNSQIAIGIPLGASVNFVDDITLKQSIINRTK